MIYTSNFARCGNDERAVSIALMPPDWYKGKEYRKLAPPKYLLNDYKYNGLSKEDYREIYYADVLSRLNPCSVIHDLSTLGDDVILLCWESASEFCHRFLVTEWLNQQLELDIEEYIEGGFCNL